MMMTDETKPLRVLAVDDEPLALRQLELYISRIPYLTLVAACHSAHEAREHLAGCDAIFTDINMPDLSGMDFIKGLDHPPLVVFTTAYADYAVEGFRVNAVDYLLKPLSFQDFEKAAGRLRERMIQQDAAGKAAHSRALFFKSDYHLVKVAADDILYIQGMGEYIKIYRRSEDLPLITLYGLAKVLSELPAGDFIQIHRSYIVARSAIGKRSRTEVILTNGQKLPIGSTFKKGLL